MRRYARVFGLAAHDAVTDVGLNAYRVSSKQGIECLGRLVVLGGQRGARPFRRW